MYLVVEEGPQYVHVYFLPEWLSCKLPLTTKTSSGSLLLTHCWQDWSMRGGQLVPMLLLGVYILSHKPKYIGIQV